MDLHWPSLAKARGIPLVGASGPTLFEGRSRVGPDGPCIRPVDVSPVGWEAAALRRAFGWKLWRVLGRSCQAEAVSSVARRPEADPPTSVSDSGLPQWASEWSGAQSAELRRSGPELRYLPDRLALSAGLLAAGAALGASYGPWVAGGLVLASALLPRRRASVVAAELGAVLGFWSSQTSPSRWLLLALGSVGLGLLVVTRLFRKRSPSLELRSCALGIGLVGLAAIDWLPMPGVAGPVSWLLLSGWALSVFLALSTEGFVPVVTPRHEEVASMSQRAFGRGSVTRNVMAAAVATAADFLVFGALLRWLSPALSTLGGCALGAIVNFTINWSWAFSSGRRLPHAAMRYVWVSAASAAFNSGAVALVLLDPGVSPVVAWAVVRTLSFLGWNYPMQRDHVFLHGRYPVSPVR